MHNSLTLVADADAIRGLSRVPIGRLLKKKKWGREPETFCQGYGQSDGVADDLIEDS